MATVAPVRAWLLAARPRTLYAIAAPVLMGAAFAFADGVFEPGPAFAAALGGLLIQVGTNIANDYYDFLKGADTAERLGAPRVTQSGILAPATVRRGMWVTFGAATLCGIYLVTQGGWPILLIGISAIAAGIAYTAGPAPLGYIGLGDLFAFLFFGPVAVAGTYYVQARTIAPKLLVAGVGVGALVTAILVVNNLRDIPTDRAAGKHTLAVRLGVRGSRIEYALLLVTAGAIPAVGYATGLWGAGVMLAIPAIFVGSDAIRRVFGFRDPRELNPALGMTAQLTAVYGLAFALGLVLTP